jgi:hypothetical protein
MPTGAPRTWASGDALTAALANAEFRDQFIALYGSPTARLYRPIAQSWTLITQQSAATIATTVAAGNLLGFTQARVNTYTGLMTTGSSPWTRLIAPIDGIYQVDGNVPWDGILNGQRAALLRLNGTTLIDVDVTNVSVASAILNAGQTTGGTGQLVGTEIRCVAGNFVELYATSSNAASTPSVITGGSLSLRWIGNLA